MVHLYRGKIKINSYNTESRLHDCIKFVYKVAEKRDAGSQIYLSTCKS